MPASPVSMAPVTNGDGTKATGFREFAGNSVIEISERFGSALFPALDDGPLGPSKVVSAATSGSTARCRPGQAAALTGIGRAVESGDNRSADPRKPIPSVFAAVCATSAVGCPPWMAAVTPQEVTDAETEGERSIATGSRVTTLPFALVERAANCLKRPAAGTPGGIGMGSEIEEGWEGTVEAEETEYGWEGVAPTAAGELAAPAQYATQGTSTGGPVVPDPGAGDSF